MKKNKFILLTIVFFTFVSSFSYGLQIWRCRGGVLKVYGYYYNTNCKCGIWYLQDVRMCGGGDWDFTLEIVANPGGGNVQSDPIALDMVKQFKFTHPQPEEQAPVDLIEAHNTGNIEVKKVHLRDLPASTIRELMKANAYNSHSIETIGRQGNVEKLTFKEVPVFNLFPNPSIGKEVSIAVNSENEETCLFRIYDISGKLVKYFELNFSKGYNSKEINISEINPGIYFTEININGIREKRKLVIQ